MRTLTATKSLVTLCVLCSSLSLSHVAAASDTKEVPLTSTMSKASYGIGFNLARNFYQQKVELDQAALEKGMRDAFAGKFDGNKGNEPALTQDDIRAALQVYQQDIQEKRTAALKKQATSNTTEAATFLADNAKKTGVITTASGLQYQVINRGKSTVKVRATDTVTVHYKGTLLNGEEFDSSYARHEPATFPVNGVIPGWTEALQLMAVGDKFMLYIPAALAYAEGGSPPKIGPNATLIFEVELLSIQSAKSSTK